MFEPNIFPITMLEEIKFSTSLGLSYVKIEYRDTSNSGKLVPNATTGMLELEAA